MRGKPYLIGCTLIAALGGLLFGFDTAVISGTTTALETVYELGSFALGFTVASALIGTILGAILVGRPADLIGRRRVLMVIGALYLISAVGSALAWDWYSFLFFRFLGGLGVGGASVVSPMYIAEISPAALRGRLVAVTQFNIVLGILLAFFSNYLLAGLDLGATEWRWMFGVEALPAAAFCLLLCLTPFSPRWLVSQGRVSEAGEVLRRLGNDDASVAREIQEIQASLDFAHHSMREPLFQRAYAKPILLAVAIAVFNQLSGINALMYYAPHIFSMAGADKSSALLQSVGVGGTNLVFTVLAMLVIDHFGRRRLMLVGSLGYILSLASTAAAFYAYGAEFSASMDAGTVVERARELIATTPSEANQEALRLATAAAAQANQAVGWGGTIVLASLLVFIASHAFGQGAVIWVFISEIFPNRVRARGQALGSFTHWVMAAAISWTFPMFAAASGGHTFAFYAVMMVFQLLWVLLVMPETKGIPLEDIQKELGIE
ncbi:MAG: sugar porter family MFS transporter [Pirellulaceae bacterium]|nr:sugar porter family MFS transporter [Pirellulaceae bacterium]